MLSKIISVLGLMVAVMMCFFAGSIFENVPAGKICVIQNMVDGQLRIFTDQGIKFQKFGKVTYYPKRFQYWFTSDEQGGEGDASIKIRFNDGGDAQISGSVSITMPQDQASITALHILYGSENAIETQLIRPLLEKSVYMSGPLMSSKESYADKRNELIAFIEDQAKYGIYKTQSKDTLALDPMTGVKKTVTVVEIVVGADGKPIREDVSPLEKLGIQTSNMSINRIHYSPTVEAQIKTQQDAIMQVQTAVANAKEAEQRAITVAKNGEAKAAESKWEQEVIKAKAIVTAEQLKEVAKLEKEAAEFEKQKQILLGQGEAERKQLVMAADGALKQKLEAWVEVNKFYATEFGKQKWTPEVQLMGGSGNSVEPTGQRMLDFMNLLTVKTAKDLQLDLGMRGK